jgi:hypothetical protein
LFWLAPLVGGAIGGALYRALFTADAAARPDITGDEPLRT